MADLRLGAIDPIRATAGRVAWEGGGHGGHREPPSHRQHQARERVATLFAPGRAPETIDLDYVVDTGGMLVAVLVRDIATGKTIARVEADDLWRLAGDEAVSGMLMERRG